MKKTLFLFSVLLLLFSCKESRLLVKGVAYQSLAMQEKKTDQKPEAEATPSEISVDCYVNENGNVVVFINNLSNSLMTIDRTKSFFMNQGQAAQMYYDPQVVVNTQSTTVGANQGASVNLGALTGARALRGVTIGGGTSEAVTNTETSYYIDQPKISVPAHGRMSMGRDFHMEGVGTTFLNLMLDRTQLDVNNQFAPEDTYAAATIYIYYSLDNEQTFHFIETTLYANTLYIAKINQQGQVNEAFRRLYMQHPDLFNAPWYLLDAPHNAGLSYKSGDVEHQTYYKFQPVTFTNSK